MKWTDGTCFMLLLLLMLMWLLLLLSLVVVLLVLSVSAFSVVGRSVRLSVHGVVAAVVMVGGVVVFGGTAVR